MPFNIFFRMFKHKILFIWFFGTRTFCILIIIFFRYFTLYQKLLYRRLSSFAQLFSELAVITRIHAWLVSGICSCCFLKFNSPWQHNLFYYFTLAGCVFNLQFVPEFGWRPSPFPRSAFGARTPPCSANTSSRIMKSSSRSSGTKKKQSSTGTVLNVYTTDVQIS